jgi:hypothetical protein
LLIRGRWRVVSCLPPQPAKQKWQPLTALRPAHHFGKMRNAAPHP